MPGYDIGYRPAGNAVRNIASMLANFDNVMSVLNTGLVEADLLDGTLTPEKLSATLANQLGVSNPSNTQRRGFQAVATEVSCQAFPTYSTMAQVTLNVPVGAIVLAAYSFEARITVGSGNMATRAIMGSVADDLGQFPTTSAAWPGELRLTSTYKYFHPGWAMIADGPTGVGVLRAEATKVTAGDTIQFRNVTLFGMVVGF